MKTIEGGICETYYLNEEDAKRYRFVKPVVRNWRKYAIVDCWIVDAKGRINPGTNVSPVPFATSGIIERGAK
jgi:hypothetical protein